jgi:hypothetical protein
MMWRWRPAKPSAESVGTVHRLGSVLANGNRAGVLMPDGTLVRCEGEPAPAKPGDWWRKPN